MLNIRQLVHEYLGSGYVTFGEVGGSKSSNESL